MINRINRNLIAGIKSLRVEIGAGGWAMLDPGGWRGKDPSVPFSCLYLMKSGECWVNTPHQSVTLRGGYGYLIPAGTSLEYGCRVPAEKLYFHLYMTKPDGYDLVQGWNRVVDTPLEEGWLDRMIAHYNGDTWMDVIAIKEGVMEVLGRLLLQFPEQNTPIPRYSPAVEQAMRYVQDNLSIQLSVGEVAAGLAMSPSTLTKRFRRETGKTLRQYVEELVFAAVQKRLIETDWPLSAISEQMGFCDQFYFSRRFRARYGMSPLSYRKGNIGK